jgi:hypothetical protein
MRGERWLLRVGEFLVGRAARHLPAAARDERYQEWAAELPVQLPRAIRVRRCSTTPKSPGRNVHVRQIPTVSCRDQIYLNNRPDI